MFNITTVQDSFLGGVGWRKHPNPAETLNPMGDMLESSSGIYFNDQHPLLTIENFKNIFDIFSDYTYSAWSALSTYSKGDIITSGGNYYVSVVDSNLNNAVGLPLFWRLTTPFNEELRRITIAGAAKTINDVLQLKNELRTSKNLLKRSQVLAIPGYKGVEFTSEDWVGWRMVPTPAQDVILTIDRIGLYLIDAVDCTISLYKNGSATAERTTTILGDGTTDLAWKEVNWQLERGNAYYLAYNRSASGITPVNGIYNMTKSWPNRRFVGTLPFAEVSGFEHAGPGQEGWSDVTDIQVNDNNFGLNLMLSARCDYTELFVDQKSLFYGAWAKAVAIGALRTMAFNANARINRNESNIDVSRILYEIEGDAIGRNGGLKKDYDAAIKLVTLDDRKLSEHCLPCKRSGVRILAT